MSAHTLAEALGGHRAGGTWMARCPAHEDDTPSLSIADTSDGRLLVHCHAGCSQEAVIAALRELGLWGNEPNSEGASLRRVAADRSPSPRERHRTAAALKIWCATRPGDGTLVASYLRSRGITLEVPSRLKLHPRLGHSSGASWPAMIGLVTGGGDDRPLAIHRTFLALDGSGKAPVEPNKMMQGPCRGGAVRLGPTSVPLMIGEGIETCLAAMQATGHSAWAALSTSGLRSLDLPRSIGDVVILADGDPPGEAAARQAASRWRQQGRRVRIAQPPAGCDFNDLLRSPLSIGSEHSP